MVSIILSLSVICIISMIFSILSIECCLSKRCWANLDFRLLCLKSLVCSWNLMLNGRSVCPIYFLSHVGHFSWYIPDLSYLFVVFFLLSGEKFTCGIICGECDFYVGFLEDLGDKFCFFTDIGEFGLFCFSASCFRWSSFLFPFFFFSLPCMEMGSYLLLISIWWIVSFSSANR
jgi:hypothetical protein